MPDSSPTAERTRHAILLAGIEVLAGNPGASIADIAAKANVSRSTFHRYFTDRTALKTAAADLAAREWEAAVRRARLSEGTGLEAYRRLCTEVMDSLSALMWWMTAAGTEDLPADEDEDESDRQIAAALHRGQEDGSIDAELSVEWLTNCLWATLYAVQCIPLESPGRIGSFDARRQALRTLLKSAAADPSSV